MTTDQKTKMTQSKNNVQDNALQCLRNHFCTVSVLYLQKFPENLSVTRSKQLYNQNFLKNLVILILNVLWRGSKNVKTFGYGI